MTLPFPATQDGWRRLIDYALHCVEAEAAAAEPTPFGNLVGAAAGSAEQLVTGRADSIPAPPALVSALDRPPPDAASGPTSLFYGWPLIVTGDERADYMAVPLFVLFLSSERTDRGWRLSPATTPEINLAAFARNADATSELRAQRLPVGGDAEEWAALVREAAGRLDLSMRGSLDPDSLRGLAPPPSSPGLYNMAAVFRDPGAAALQITMNLHRDLSAMRERTDWEDTAAGVLLGAAQEPSPADGPLAAPLRVNRAQLGLLETIRTQPLTVITGPPGTGKTQVVVNAVATAALDGDRVLVTSTNNAAVNEPFARVRGDIAPGVLVRTGNRDVKAGVAEQISAAYTHGGSYEGRDSDFAVRRLRRVAEARAVIAERADRVRMLRSEARRIEAGAPRTEDDWREIDEVVRGDGGGDPESAWAGAGDAARTLFDAEREQESSAELLAETLSRRDRALAEVTALREDLQDGSRPVAPPGSAEAAADAAAKAREPNARTLLGLGERRHARLRRTHGLRVDAPMDDVARWAEAEGEWLESSAALDAARRRDAAAAPSVASAAVALAVALERPGAGRGDLGEWAAAGVRAMDSRAELERARTEIERLEREGRSEDGDRGQASALAVADEDWRDASLDAVRARSSERLGSDMPDFGNVSLNAGPFSNMVAQAMDRFPAWACTTMSLRGSFPLEAGFFDLTILDEASQCSLAAVLPAAYRTLRLAVIGDPNQLRPVATAGEAIMSRIVRASGADETALHDSGFHHLSGSAYRAFAHVADPFMFTDHYRCHPSIARWFNEAFYGGRLDVLTDISEWDPLPDPLAWVDCDAESARPPRGGGWVNERQALAAVEALREALRPGLTAGVITPYRAQAAKIEQYAKRDLPSDVLDAAEFLCGTAHRLQGAERDVIVFATTATPRMPNSALAWMEIERYLINVAVSRARRSLIVIGHPRIDAVRSPTLHGLREYVLGENWGADPAADDAAGAAGDGSGAGVDMEAARRCARQAMEARGLQPLADFSAAGYELDFALDEGDVRINVEIEDRESEPGGERSAADRERDGALQAAGWHVVRVSARRCCDQQNAIGFEIATAVNRLRMGSEA